MSQANALIKRISKAIKRVGPMSRTSYLRTTTITGGDELIGRGSTTSNTDALFNPQPVYRQLGHRQAMYLSTNTVQLVADDYKFTFPVTQVSKDNFEQANTYIVLKDENGEERFRVLYISTEDLGGEDLVINVFARSIGYANPSVVSITGPIGSTTTTVQQYIDQQIAAVEAQDATDDAAADSVVDGGSV